MTINIRAIGAFLLSLVATVFFIAATVDDDWSHYSTSLGGDAQTGPFRARSGNTEYRYDGCDAGGGVKWTGSDCDQWLALQAFTIIGLILAAIATLVYFCSTFTWRYTGNIGSTLSALAGVSGIIAMSIFADFNDDKMSGSNYGPGYICIIIAWIFSFIASCVGCGGGTKVVTRY